MLVAILLSIPFWEVTGDPIVHCVLGVLGVWYAVVGHDQVVGWSTDFSKR